MGGKKSRIVPVSGNYVHEFIVNKINNNEIVREEEWNILYKEMDRYTPDEALKLYNSITCIVLENKDVCFGFDVKDVQRFIKVFVDNGRLMNFISDVIEYPDPVKRTRIRKEYSEKIKNELETHKKVAENINKLSTLKYDFVQASEKAFDENKNELNVKFPFIDWTRPTSMHKSLWACILLKDLNYEMKLALAHAIKNVNCTRYIYEKIFSEFQTVNFL